MLWLINSANRFTLYLVTKKIKTKEDYLKSNFYKRYS